MDPAAKQAAKYKTQSLLGIMQDKMEVGMAKIRGEESAALDVAIIKATLQDEVVPKEKHVRTLKIACSGNSPRQTVNYVIHGLAKRLEENPKAWLVTLKTLVVFHRIMRETDPSFQEELLRYAERTGHHRLLRLESFADHTTKETWDYSAWIRVYSLYLDERLAVFRSMRFDPEQEGGPHAGATGASGETPREVSSLRESKLKTCSAQELLDHLPSMQRLLSRLVSCVPEGAAQTNEIALLACSLVLKELRAVYKVVCEGVLNLVDRIFEMDRGDALKGLELVKENLAVNDKLNTFMGSISNIPPLRGAVQFPQLQPLPSDFLTTLEDYIKDAPKGSGDAGKPSVGRTSATAVRASTKLVVGGPVKDSSSGPTSPQTAAPPAPPQPAPEVDLLGGFESFNINPTPAAAPQPAAAGAPAPHAPGAPFDPFASFGTAPAAATPPPHPGPQQPEPAAAAPPPPPPAAVPYSYGAASSFANPAAAAAAAGGAYGFPGVPAPQAPGVPPPAPPPAAGPFGENLFGGGNPAFGAPAPAFPPAAGAPPPPAPQPEAAPPVAAAAPAAFNPFANPAMHATVAPHMPPAPPAPAAPAPATPIPAAAPAPPPPPPAPAAPSPLNAFAQAPVPPPLAVPGFPQPPYPGAPAPQTPGAAQTPPVYGGMPPPGMQPQQPIPANFANPFSSPGGPAPAPANPFASPGPSPTNPFGAPTPGATAPGVSNPFGGGAPGGAGWAGTTAAPTVVTQQVGGYNLKKAADPLMDLSLDLFGKPQAPPAQQPMRPQALGTAAPNGAGSPF